MVQIGSKAYNFFFLLKIERKPENNFTENDKKIKHTLPSNVQYYQMFRKLKKRCQQQKLTTKTRIKN